MMMFTTGGAILHQPDGQGRPAPLPRHSEAEPRWRSPHRTGIRDGLVGASTFCRSSRDRRSMKSTTMML
jgi:hypothetical protein